MRNISRLLRINTMQDTNDSSQTMIDVNSSINKSSWSFPETPVSTVTHDAGWRMTGPTHAKTSTSILPRMHAFYAPMLSI